MGQVRHGLRGVAGRRVWRLGEGGDPAPNVATVGEVREVCGVEDNVAIEEPLEIRIASEPVATTMRTPGDDGLLALGFLFAEGIVTSIDDVGTLAHCGRPGEEGFGNVIDVTPGAGVSLDIDRIQLSRRGTLITAACGVCGRRSIEDLRARCGVLPDGPVVAASLLTGGARDLRGHQPNFERTGGTHAAAALAADGTTLASFEDVGRHNAVDKVVGALLKERLVGTGRPGEAAAWPVLLCVSGRASFEIVQKAAAARIPIVASVSAASSLAIDLARTTGITLAAFVRGDRLSVYSRPERIAGT